MEGCARRERRKHAHAMAAGWHAENFRRFGNQLRGLDHYLKQLDSTPANPADEAAAIFSGLAKQGRVRIREVPRSESPPVSPERTPGAFR